MKALKVLLVALGFILFFISAFVFFGSPQGNITGSFAYSPKIKIINYDNSAALNNSLNVDFTTEGVSDLVISPINGKGEFLGLKCNNQIQAPAIYEKSIVYKNYNCNSRSSILFKILSKDLEIEFGFGNDLEYAKNSAS